MALIKLQFRPGIVRDMSSYANSSGWYDCNLMRFRFGLPQPFKGWAKYTTTSFAGTCRSLHNWIALDGSNYLGIGTHLKFYVEEGGAFSDITPIRSSVTLNGPFAATNGSNEITVTDVAHGCDLNGHVTFSGATGLGGTVTATILNANHRVVDVINDDTYKIRVSVTANASDSGDGGASVGAAYEISPGLTTQVGGGGWGAGEWSRGTWGSGVDSTTVQQLRLWFQDNFGEDLIFNESNGAIYYWDASAGGRAVTLDSLTTDTTVPTVARQVLVSDRDRHVIALGCDNGDGVRDPLLIRFSSQENPYIWVNLPTNTAGELRVGSGSEIVCAVETKRELIVFTDSSIHSMQYLGPPVIFGIQQVAGLISIMSPKSAMAVEDTVFWMSRTGFSMYAGTAMEMQCPVRDRVFNDINLDETDKIHAAHNPSQTEVLWFYCSEASAEPDRYVCYNYGEKVWYYGGMERTAWSPSTLRDYPIATTVVDPELEEGYTIGYLYNQEFGNDDEEDEMEDCYIESSPIELGNGDQYMMISRLIPDITFENSTTVEDQPLAFFIFKTSRFPGVRYSETESSLVRRTNGVSATVEKFTPYKNIRLRGRQVVMRVEKNGLGTFFTLGTPRLEVRPDGRQ